MAELWTVYARREFWRELKKLPGHKRRAVEGVPATKIVGQSRTPEEVRRWRSGTMRVLYMIHDENRWVALIAIRERPPYDYEDLDALLDED